MSQFENHFREANDIESALAVKLLILGVDISSDFEMSDLARRIHDNSLIHEEDHKAVKQDIQGLVVLMFKVMEEGMHENRDVHGGIVWKSLAKHLYKLQEQSPVEKIKPF